MESEFNAHGCIAAPRDTAFYQCGSPGVGVKILEQYFCTGTKGAIGLDTDPGLIDVKDETGIESLVYVVVGWNHARCSWHFPPIRPMISQIQFVSRIHNIFIIIKIVIHYAVPSMRFSVPEYIPKFSLLEKYYRLER